MATFTDRIRVLIDVDGKGAKTGFGKFRQDVNQAQGATSKFKTVAGGAFTAVKANAALFSAAAGAALIKFGTESVKSFTDGAIAAGQFSDATGLSIEESSKWLSYADDLGLSGDTLQKSFLRLNKELGEGSEMADQYGISLQTTADGQSDVNGTMLLAIDRIGEIRDPTERAAAAQELFGRSYAEVAEIVLSDSKKVLAGLESTSDAQIFDEGELAKAKDYRASMDKFNDVIADLTLTVGEGLTPVLASLADTAGDVGNATKGVSGALEDVGVDSEMLTNGAWANLKMAFSDDVTGGVSEEFLEAGRAAATLGDDTDEATEAAEAHAAAIEAETAKVKAETEALEASAEVLNDIIGAKMDLADSTYALNDAEDEFLDTLTDSNTTINDQGSTLRDVRQALDNAAEAADKVAESQVSVAESTAAAAGRTLSATQRVDTYNQSMLTSAATASGPLRASILAHIATVNGIPASKMTEIQAAIDRGDVAEANRLLNDASRTRTAAVTADAKTWDAENKINYTARDRTSTVWVQPRFLPGQNRPNGVPEYARGTGGATGGPAIVGERGPEIVNLNRGDTVTDAARTKRAMTGGRRQVVNITNNFPPGTRPDDVARATRRYNQVQGPI